MTDRPTPDDHAKEQQVRAALAAVAAAPGAPDEQSAWPKIQARMERARPSGRRRAVIALSSAAAAGAVVLGIAVLARGDDRQAVEVGPIESPTTDGNPSPTTAPTTDTSETSLPTPPTAGFPARPLAVVVSEDGMSRLDLHDADTGALVTRGLARSGHSLSQVSFGPDGTVYFTEEFGDSSTVRAVPWDGSAAPVTPFDAGGETSSPALSPDGSTFAYVHQGITTDGGEIVLVDTATGERRALRWAEGEPDFFLTNGSIEGVEWSPDGSRLLFVVSYEGSDPLVLAADASSLSDAEAVAGLSAFHVHWWGPDRVVGLHSCCYPEFDEQPELRSVELGGQPVALGEAGEPIAFDVDRAGVVALVRADGTVHLLDPASGSSTEIATEHPALEVGF